MNTKNNHKKTRHKSSMILLFSMIFAFSACNGISKLDLEPESLEFYQKTSILFTKIEKKKFKKLNSIKDRKKFIQQFWLVRNPNPHSDDNIYKDEINRRWDFVNHYFNEGSRAGWQTDRGRIYMQFGEPDHIESQSIFNNPSIHGYIYWYFGNHAYRNTFNKGDGFGVFFVDSEGHGRYRIDMQRTSMQLLEASKKVNYQHIRESGKEVNVNDIVFSVNYEKEFLIFQIAPKNLVFGYDSNKMIVKLKISLVYFSDNKKKIKHSETKKIVVNKEKLLKDGYRITVKLPIKILNKKSSLDIHLLDMLGNASSRKFLKNML